MNRAALVIGVQKTGGLTPLRGPHLGADRIAAWLEAEGFKVVRKTDADGPVTAASLFDEVAKLVNPGIFEQLVIYFAGHGFVKGLSEYWLLSGAPQNPNEAIVVNESVDLARGAGIPSVVFISDACRSTMESLKAQRVRGSLLFPNEPPTADSEVTVDRFFATRVGDAALELAIDASTNEYDGIFTYCLREAFRSLPERLQRVIKISGEDTKVVPNRQLHDHLRDAVPAALAEKKVNRRQRPDAIVESDDDVYIAPVRGVRSTPLATPESAEPKIAEPDPVQLIRKSLDQASRLFTPTYDFTVPPDYDPTHTGSRGGFLVSGTTIAWAKGVGCEVDVRGSEVRVNSSDPLCSVVLGFNGGTGTVLAALYGHDTHVFVRDGRVYDVAYIPTPSGYKWLDYLLHKDLLVERRRIVADATRTGIFRVESTEDAEQIAQDIRIIKSIDPALGLYAAYAYAASGKLKSIRSVRRYMRYDLGGGLYDVALLAGDRPDPTRKDIAPFVPMLSQGWPLLRGRRGVIPAAAEAASEHLLDSLWTTFAEPGMSILRATIENGQIP